LINRIKFSEKLHKAPRYEVLSPPLLPRLITLKYPPHHHILKHTQPLFAVLCQTPSVTHTKSQAKLEFRVL
jgi:hypothetical protein